MIKSLTAIMVSALILVMRMAYAEKYYVSVNGNDGGSGTVTAPLRTLQRGVSSLKPGDSLFIGAGIYRETVLMRRGGTSEAPITISAQPGARVIVSGADSLDGGWKKEAGTQEAIYWHDWSYRFPIGGPNELTHPGDREHQLTGRAEQVIHSGRLLRQVLNRAQVAPGTFFVDLAAGRLFVWLRGSDDPNNTEIEASVRGNWVATEPGVSYVHIRGLVFRYAANHAQRGAFALGQSGGAKEQIAQKWLVEDCVFERANGPGASISGRRHVFRRCVFQDNGQLGFGASRCDETRMEQCRIYRNNVKGYSTGWEAGGCKVTMSRAFVFEGCRSVDNRGTGIWFDIGNEKSEVAHCYVADNDEAGIFYEISYGLHAHDNLIVNNANNGEAVGGAWGEGGITLSSSEDCLIENNTLVGNRDGIAFREQNRSTPRIDAVEGANEVRILNKNHLIRSNIVAYSQAYSVALWMDTTFFGPHPSGGDKNAPLFEDPKTLNIQFSNNLLWPLPGNVNYLYGAPWRVKSRKLHGVEDFTAASGIADSSRILDPRFSDVTSGDFRLETNSPASAGNIGIRGLNRIPIHQ